ESRGESLGKIAASKPGRQPSRRDWLRARVKHLIHVATGFGLLYPLVWTLVSSFKPNDLVFREPVLMPSHLDLSNDASRWTALLHPFSHYLLNSAIIVLGAVLGNLISCAMAAYAFARLNFRFRGLWFAITLISIMIPIHVIIVPQYVLFSEVG